MGYEIFSDVSIDIDKAFLEQYQVRFVPMEYMLGEDTFHCDRPESDEMMHDYYDKLRQAIPTRTSQIAPFHYVSVFEPYVKEKKALLYLSLSSGLSNTYESARMAVEMLKETYGEVRVEVVDSLGATGGMGLLTEAACRNREAGMSLEENAAWLRENAGRVNYWFKVEDLMYLKRGGRISAATAVIGTALNIKPILTIKGDGKLDTIAKKRGDSFASKYMIEQFSANFDGSFGDTVYICCADCKDNAEKLKQMVLEVHPELTVKITMLSPIIGAHTGPDMLSLIHFGKARVSETNGAQ
ncbi:MAG: DegV family protein [Eubacterium sp.]|nr:DegV family protein [Eubacterium sp.]MCM1302899.1 DegV family protein [Butyrivibrio sp.]MCM1345148.1 DegV family protein [Muribaculaceae bacterium]MCM1410427.1 DegV family protein [Lachnospiraceae bacterium]